MRRRLGHFPSTLANSVNIVVIETSASCGEIAIADETKIVDVRAIAAARKHARELAPLLKEMLGRAFWSPKSIGLVIVGIGPGSYTGLRVGVMAAKTLAYATGAEIVGVDSLANVAESAPCDCQLIAAIADAQQGLLYAGSFGRAVPEGAPIPLGSPQIVRGCDWIASRPAGTYLTGPALSRFRSAAPSECLCASEDASQPTAHACWAIGMRLYKSGRRDDFWSIEPRYLRPSAAEEKRPAQA